MQAIILQGGNMKKKLLPLSVLLSVSLSLVGFSSNVFAYDSSGTVSLTRGGSSLWVNSDYKGNTGGWEACISSASVIGLPSGNYGNTYIVTRMYAADKSAKASETLTFSPSSYQVNLSQSYNSGYGGIGQWYWLKANMSSASSNSGGTFQISFSA